MPYNEQLATDEAIQLLLQMLVIDHTKRITAKEAMRHPYFKEISEVVVKKGWE